ncbi:MAG: hypothetical protein R3F61_02900 [Myxococcota bacterium]
MPSELVSAELGMAQCPSCEQVFEVAAAPPAPVPALPPVAREPKAAPPELPLAPSGVSLARTADSLVITYTWSRLGGVGLLLFSGIWWTFLAFWLTGVLASGAWMMGLFAIFHVGAGVFMAYSGVASLLNTTTVVVHRGRLEVEIGPVPWPGAHDIPVADLSQLYVQQVRKRNKNGETITYDLHAVSRGEDFVLVKGFTGHQPAKFIERVIEQHLGIVDRAMPGEH